MKNRMKDKRNVYAFIDSQNLHLGVKSLGWEIDYRKFRQYLKNKYHVTKAYMFIGYKAGNESLYANLQEMGYVVVMKPTLEYKEGKIKGNVDAELVLHAMIQFKTYSSAIIVSNDGDFHCLVDYLQQQSKLHSIFVPNRKYSSLLRQFNRYIVRVDTLQQSLQKKTKISGRSKP
jgi:uncharacterized LabA/DUF88 family protein